MQSEWIIGFLILLIFVQLFMIITISTPKKMKADKREENKCDKYNKYNKCNKCNKYFKESYTTTDSSLISVFREIYNNNMNKYVRLYKQNVFDLNLNETLTQIVSSGEKIGKSKEDIKKELEAKDVDIKDIKF